MAYFYDLGVSCLDESSAIEIASEFQQKTLELSNQHSLVFECNISQKGQEWLISIYPFGMAWGRPETNVELFKDKIIEETGKRVYEILQSKPGWVYYYALFQAEAHDRILEDELLVSYWWIMKMNLSKKTPRY
jgi:hypothetical protein